MAVMMIVKEEAVGMSIIYYTLGFGVTSHKRKE